MVAVCIALFFLFDKYLYLPYTCHILVKRESMVKRRGFKFYSTVSDRGQIFIPKALQDYCGIRKRDKVVFIFRNDGSIVFTKKEGGGK